MKQNITTKRLNQLQGKMPLRAFAEQVGIGQSTLHNYLKGRDIKGSYITQICAKTHTDANWLLGLTDKKDSNIKVKMAGVKMEIASYINGLKTLLKNLEVK